MIEQMMDVERCLNKLYKKWKLIGEITYTFVQKNGYDVHCFSGEVKVLYRRNKTTATFIYSDYGKSFSFESNVFVLEK